MAKAKTISKTVISSETQDGKYKALEDALQKIEKQFGKGSVMKLSQNRHMNIDVSSTGSLNLDIALGIQGLPKGRIVEVFGPESSGKTTLTLHCIAEVQKQGGIAAFIDVEHSLDPVYAKALGVDIDNLIISQPDTAETALEIAERLISSGAIDVLVLDSVAALVPKAEIDGDIGDSHVGLQARMMGQALRKLTGAINKTNCLTIFINQIREKVGIIFGSPETTPGGRSLRFFSSVRLDVRKIDTIKSADKVLGNRVRVKVVKNKVAPPFTQAEFDIMYGEGICKTGEVIDKASELQIINKGGAWYSYGDIRIQGREKLKAFLKDNSEIMDEIELKIRDYYKTTESVEEE